MDYIGVRAIIGETVNTNNFVGVVTEKSEPIKANTDYVLQFKIINYSSESILNHIVAIDDSGNETVLSNSLSIYDFEKINSFLDEGIIKDEYLCYLVFQLTKDSKYRFAISRKQTSNDTPKKIVFDVRDVSVEKGSVLKSFRDNSNDYQEFVKKCETYFEQNDKRLLLMAKKEDTNKTNAQIEVKANEILTKVSEEYATKKSVSEVSQKADSIKTSITTTLENDYTKKTEFIQTSSDFEFRIHESESKNLMPNSSFEKKETYTRNHNFILDWTKGGGTTAYPESIDGGQYILLYTNDADSYFVKNEAIKIKANTHYTISFYYCASQTMSGSNYLFINGNPVNIPTEYNGDRAWHRHSYTIITNDNVDGITGIRFGCIANGESWLLIDNVQIEEGDTATKYRYKQNEICNGNAFIDWEGIGVAHTDGSYSKMTVSGFRRHVGSTNHDYHYLTYTGSAQKTDMSSVSIQLPDEFKGKSFMISLGISEIANEAGWMIQSLQVLTQNIDYENATFEIIGGSQSQYHDGTEGESRPTTVSYTVIA